MSEAEVLDWLYDHYCSLFPKTCKNCLRCFESLADYVISTEPVGRSVSYDADSGNWDLHAPVGAAAMANCACGSTIALTTDGMPMERRRHIMNWIREQTVLRRVSPSEVLEGLRHQIRARALSS